MQDLLNEMTQPSVLDQVVGLIGEEEALKRLLGINLEKFDLNSFKAGLEFSNTKPVSKTVSKQEVEFNFEKPNLPKKPLNRIDPQIIELSEKVERTKFDELKDLLNGYKISKLEFEDKGDYQVISNPENILQDLHFSIRKLGSVTKKDFKLGLGDFSTDKDMTFQKFLEIYIKDCEEILERGFIYKMKEDYLQDIRDTQTRSLIMIYLLQCHYVTTLKNLLN